MKRRIRTTRENAVSPVVGVMLMLVVVITIAAIVTGFSGGLIGGATKKAPTLGMDVKVVNTGDWRGSGFFATVTGVSEPIPTKDLKIVTSWTEKTTRTNYLGRIDILRHDTTIVPNGSSNINVLFNPGTSLNGLYAAPFGNGPGVNGTESLGSNARSYSLPQQQFGNYTLMQGTTLVAQPAGGSADSIGSSAQDNNYGGYFSGNASYTYQQYVPGVTTTCYWVVSNYKFPTPTSCIAKSSPLVWTSYCYTDGTVNLLYTRQATRNCPWTVYTTTSTSPDHYVPVTVPASSGTKYQYNHCDPGSCTDPARAVLGNDWNYMRWGNTVNVKVIYTPTGAVIFNKDVTVTES